MSLLFRYVFSSHARLMLLILSAGVSLYVLTELVDRIDTFLEADSGLWIMLQYFGARLPGIVAQILPAVFLLASVITLCMMVHSREMTALQAGGVSPNSVALVLVACGVFWGAAQFGCSQWLGSEGERFAKRMWQEEVRKREYLPQYVDNIWFTDREWIVSLESLSKTGEGENLSAYQLSGDGLNFSVIVRAPRFTATAGEWTAYSAQRISPNLFLSENLDVLPLPLTQDPRIFFLTGRESPQTLPLWRLSDAIDKFRAAGSNVEGLLTAWHGKLAYAASLVVMAVMAAAIVSWRDSVYIAVGLAIMLTFVSYVLTLFGESMGQRGLLPPVPAAWGPNALLLTLALLRLHYVRISR